MIKKKLADTKEMIMGFRKRTTETANPELPEAASPDSPSNVKQAILQAQIAKLDAAKKAKEEADAVKRQKKDEKAALKRQQQELKEQELQQIQSNRDAFSYVVRMLEDAAEQLKNGDKKDYKVVEHVEPEADKCEWFLLKGSSVLRYVKAGALYTSGTIIGIGAVALAVSETIDAVNNDVERATYHYSNRLDQAGLPDPTTARLEVAGTTGLAGGGIAVSCFEKASSIIKDSFLRIKATGSNFLLECGDDSVTTSSLDSEVLETALVALLQKHI